MEFGLSLSQEQKQILSATQIQSLQLLAMDNFELHQMVEAEYLENPLLEYRQHSFPAPIQKGYVQDDENRNELPAKENVLFALVSSQLNPKKYEKKDWAVIRFLVDSLDDRGFLPAEPQQIASMTGVNEKTIRRLLSDLRQLEPRGIFARDLRECLLLQLEDTENPDWLVRTLIESHLDDLSRGEIHALSKQLSVPCTRIRKAVEEIACLNPCPLNGLDTSATHYIVPDILLELNPDSGELEAALTDDWIPDYHLSDYYLQMLRATEDPELSEYFKGKYQRAKMLVDGIAQRRQTMLAIGNFLGHRQRDFLLGRGPRATVTMTDAAAELGFSISTISRAVKGKYIQHPNGCTALKELFDTPVSRGAPENLSRDAIKIRLKTLIRQEDPANPLSDAALADALLQQGIALSRRTVAKYRESLGIPGCFDRRRY